jgi:aldehyde:ferredoxin oxidoreductase
MHEPRGKVGVGMIYALSPNGADYTVGPHDPIYEMEHDDLKTIGITKAVDRLDLGTRES